MFLIIPIKPTTECIFIYFISDSYLGYDFVLIKLSKDRGDGRANGRIMPICLAGKGFPEFKNENVFMAGFGRRQIPHCLTDMQGPDRFQVVYNYNQLSNFNYNKRQIL